MRFGIYSELQCHPWQTPGQVYAETLEQAVNADRLGYDCYSIIEHPFFAQFGVSTNPFAFFGAAATRTQRIRFRTLIHILPFHNPGLLAGQIAEMDHLTGGRYEFGVGRGHGWLPPKGGLPLDTRARYEESFQILMGMLESPDGFSFEGEHYRVENARIVPTPRSERFRIFTGGTSDRTYELAGEKGWGVVVPPLLPYEILRPQLDVYREACDRHGNDPDIVFIHAIYLDEDAGTIEREAKDWMLAFLAGNASPAPELPPKEALVEAGYGFYASGALEQLAAMTWEEITSQDVVWVGTPEEIVEKIEALREQCPGLTEVAMTVNAGGNEHWKAIKTQELFARHVIPSFRTSDVAEAAATA